MNLSINEIINSDPRFWGTQRQKVLRICIPILEKYGQISQESLHEIIAQFAMKDIESLSELKTIESTLTRLKDKHGVNTVIPPLPTTYPRQSVLSASSQQLAQFDGSLYLEDYFWSTWLQTKLRVQANDNEQQEVLLFAFAFTVIMYGGIRSHQIIDAMTNLRFSDVSNDHKTLKIKVHPKDKHNRYLLFSLSTPTQLIIKKVLSNTKNIKPEHHLFIKWKEDKFKKRKTAISVILNKHYINLLNASGSSLATPSTWKLFAKAVYMKPIFKGLEPFIITALSRYPLPVSHPEESAYKLLKDSDSNMLDTCLYNNLGNPRPTVKLISTKKIDDPNRKNVYDDWAGESKTILKQLVTRLKRITKKKINTPSQIEAACSEIDHSLLEAKDITPNEKSALHLALLWIKNYIKTNKSISPATINNYFERVFYHGLLKYSDSDNLTLWSTQDHELAFEEALSRRHINDSRKKNIIATYQSVYTYAVQNEFTEYVDIKFIGAEWVGSTMRSEMIGLHLFDFFIKTMIELGERQNIIIAVTAILAFYGGLRSCETTHLTLKDVSVDKYKFNPDDELYIEVLNGKTQAARRRVPLHLFAPPHMCEIVKTYYQNRFNEFKEPNTSSRSLILKNIPLFGPPNKREAYIRKSSVDSTISELKNYIGDNLVYHSLRHSFVSWTLLRWYTIRYPSLCLELSDRHHEIFMTNSQKRLCLYFADGKEELPNYNSNDLIKLSKVVGHNGQETMFSTYIHSFGVIHHHAMQRISKVVGQRKLNGKTIGVLIPKMKTRKSQVKIKDKTINGLIDYDSLITSKRSEGVQLK